jgi:Ca2+-binding RTX toxin-like protein
MERAEQSGLPSIVQRCSDSENPFRRDRRGGPDHAVAGHVMPTETFTLTDAIDAILGADEKDAIVIPDVDVGDDSIQLDNAVFKGIGKGTAAKPGRLDKEFFVKAATAKEADDHVLYNAKTGALLYDADGSGFKAAVQIATLAKNLKLAAADFFVI